MDADSLDLSLKEEGLANTTPVVIATVVPEKISENEVTYAPNETNDAVDAASGTSETIQTVDASGTNETNQPVDAFAASESCVIIASAVSNDIEPAESKKVDASKKIEPNDSWELLNHENNQMDSEVAMAAQVLGSTLFLSNMSSNLSVDSHMSVDSSSFNGESVATNSASRWEKQLQQLNELGFINQNLNIDVLESLEAANIGVDSVDEPVTVEQAVHKLLGPNH